MGRAKEEVQRILEQLPEDASLEDVQYHIYVRQAIERGLAAADAGDLVDQDEAERRLAKWLGE
jgi:predicted transcriptional regulator